MSKYLQTIILLSCIGFLSIRFLNAPAIAADCLPGKQVDDTFLRSVVQKLRNPGVAEEAIPFAVAALKAWLPYENTNACWNPLATMQGRAGATRFNSVGVRNYPDAEAGAEATAQTLNYSFYAAIRKMLAHQEFDETGLRTALKKWSGSGSYSDALLAKWATLYTELQPCVDDARFVTQSRYPTLMPEQDFELFFDLENNGTCVWRVGENYRFINTNMTALGAMPSIPLSRDVAPGETYRWGVSMTTPEVSGVYTTEWQMAHGDTGFGVVPWIRVSVVERRDADNRSAAANELIAASSQIHGLTPAGDADWFRFELTQPSQVTVRTAGESGDTQLWLYDQREEEIAYNDDAGGSYFSRIELSCDSQPLPPGKYFVKVSAYDPEESIAQYTIYLLSQSCSVNDSSPELPVTEPTSTVIVQPQVRYQVNVETPVCGGIIAFQLIPSDESRNLNFRMTKCDNTPIRADGNLSIVVDGIYSIGPYRYYSGEMGVDGWIDPLGDLGLSGEHRYEAYVYPDGQDYPIISGVVLAWDVAE